MRGSALQSVLRREPPQRGSPPRRNLWRRIASELALAPWSAFALNNLLAVGVVVVSQFFTGFDVAAGADPDLAADDMAIAIGTARMVDEPRDVATRHRVAHPARIHRETPDLPALEILRLAFEALFVIDEFTVIGDDAAVLVDRLEGKNAPAV